MKLLRSSATLALTSLLLVSVPRVFAQHGSATAPSPKAEAAPLAAVSAAALQSLAVAMSDASAALSADDFAFVRSTVNGLDALNDLKDATGASIEMRRSSCESAVAASAKSKMPRPTSCRS